MDKDVKNLSKSTIFIDKNNIKEIIEKVKSDVANMKSEIISELN